MTTNKPIIKSNMTQKEFCKKYNLTEAQFLGKEKIEGNVRPLRLR